MSLSHFVHSYITELKQCLDRLDMKAIEQATQILLRAYTEKKQIFLIGNGGSASTASHMACDLSKGTLQRIYDEGEERFRVFSLTDNAAVMTAFANDVSFEDVFVQQLRNLIQEGDVLIVMSGSGNSPNLIKAVRYAKKRHAQVIGFLGFGGKGKLTSMVDCAIIAHSGHYGPSEDIQLILDHIIVSCISKIKGQENKNRAVPFQ